MSNERVYELAINESVKIKSGWLSRSFVLYAGMPNERTYSLVITYTNVHNSIGYNLYIPKSQNEVKLARGKMIVRRVTPTGITFTIDRGAESVGRAPL